MAVKPVPEGYHTITPYLTVSDASGLLDCITRAFDATTRMSCAGRMGASAMPT